MPVSAHTQVTDLALNDHACLTFGAAAASVGPSRTVVLSCRPSTEARFAQLGVDLQPHVSLVGVHDK